MQNYTNISNVCNALKLQRPISYFYSYNKNYKCMIFSCFLQLNVGKIFILIIKINFITGLFRVVLRCFYNFKS